MFDDDDVVLDEPTINELSVDLGDLGKTDSEVIADTRTVHAELVSYLV